MLLIIGRVGSGKEELAEKLEAKGYSVAKKFTTHKSIADNRKYVDYVDEKTASERKNAIAQSVVGDYIYYTTADELKDKDILIVDPYAADKIAGAMPNEIFNIVYIQMERELRMHNEKKPYVAERNDAEEDMYNEFEVRLSMRRRHEPNMFRKNIHKILVWKNNLKKVNEDVAVEKAKELIDYENIYII